MPHRTGSNRYTLRLLMSSVSLLMRLTTVAALLMGFVGCGSVDTGEVVPTVPANGTLMYKGQPLEYHQVTLFPTDNQRPASGISDAEGNFVLGTNQPEDGAIQGTHTVSITYVGPPATDPGAGMMEFPTPPPPKVKLPEHYRDPQRSGITVEIPAGGLRDWQLDLK